jgi:hypothetical protein
MEGWYAHEKQIPVLCFASLLDQIPTGSEDTAKAFDSWPHTCRGYFELGLPEKRSTPSFQPPADTN